MKRFCLIALCSICITSCLEPLYFEPDVIETSSTEENISSLGDTCWFLVTFKQVETKFTNAEYFKPFKYVVEIEGLESSDPVLVETEGVFSDIFTKQHEDYPEVFNIPNEDGVYVPGDAILFFVPANESESQRKVEVKFSVSDVYHAAGNWSEWETIFSAIQDGTK